LLNELATNATKYGALSVEEGRLKLGWTVQDEWTVIEWKEIGGPAVAKPAKAGFGSRLFENAMPKASGGANVCFEPNGLRCEIKLRTSAASAHDRRAEPSEPVTGALIASARGEATT
jgi:two-component sensor histidine kinase